MYENAFQSEEIELRLKGQENRINTLILSISVSDFLHGHSRSFITKSHSVNVYLFRLYVSFFVQNLI